MPANIINGSDGSGSVQNIPANIANGIMDARNPAILPMVDPILVRAVGVPGGDEVSRLQNEPIPDYIVDAGQTAAQATGSVLFGGTETDGDTLNLTLAGTTLTYTTMSGDTLTSIAASFASLINSNATTMTSFHATSTGPTLNISALSTGKWFNSFGNAASIQYSTSMGATETATITAMHGGAGLLWPQVDFNFSYTEPASQGSAMMYFLKGRPFVSNDTNMLFALAQTGAFGPNT